LRRTCWILLLWLASFKDTRVVALGEPHNSAFGQSFGADGFGPNLAKSSVRGV
jgi:hypothetical protein